MLGKMLSLLKHGMIRVASWDNTNFILYGYFCCTVDSDIDL